jgi:hypothetical protein
MAILGYKALKVIQALLVLRELRVIQGQPEPLDRREVKVSREIPGTLVPLALPEQLAYKVSRVISGQQGQPDLRGFKVLRDLKV